MHRLTDHAAAGDGMIGMEWCYYVYFTANTTFDKNYDEYFINHNRSLQRLCVVVSIPIFVDHLVHIDLVLSAAII